MELIFGKIQLSKNLSFRSLSHKCDLDYTDLNKIEKGKRNITFSTIIKLAKGLDIHPRELFDFSFSLVFSGVILFYKSYPNMVATRRISDHIPVWAEFGF